MLRVVRRRQDRHARALAGRGAVACRHCSEALHAGEERVNQESLEGRQGGHQQAIRRGSEWSHLHIWEEVGAVISGVISGVISAVISGVTCTYGKKSVLS